MDDQAVWLRQDALNRHFKFLKIASNFAQSANLVASSVPYDLLRPSYPQFDRIHGVGLLRDPLRHALKQQKFFAIAGYGQLYAAAEHAKLHNKQGYTPLSTGTLARSGLESLAYFLYTSLPIPGDDAAFLEQVYRIYNAGMRGFNWNDKSGARDEIIKIFSNWSSSQGLRAKPKFDPNKIVNPVVTVDEDPYGFLSDFVHANPVLLGLSVIDSQENLNLDVQWDFKAVAILVQIGTAALEKFADQYSDQIKSSEFYELSSSLGCTANALIAKQEQFGWGDPKPIPDRDFNK